MPDYPVTVVDRGTITADTNMIIDGFRTATATDPNPDLVRGDGVVYNLVFDHPDGTVLWDTGSDPDCSERWPRQVAEVFTHADARPLSDDLSDIGYSLDDIDMVVQSHLHLDHAGGLAEFEGSDVPIYVHRDEIEYAYYSVKTDAADGDEAYLEQDFDRDLNWHVVDREQYTLLDGLELLHLPGHSPGLLGMRCTHDEETLLVIGDQAYTAPNYLQGASMGASLLWSARDWHASRARCQELERRDNATVLYGHDSDQISTLGPQL
jgi:glyoxylase-like metal-dependent hydrolase (beta-lactamase superfamily II)